MRAEAGIWMTGMTSKMLVKKMKKNSAEQVGRVLEALLAHGLHDDAVLDELDRHLGQVLRAGGHQLLLVARG